MGREVEGDGRGRGSSREGQRESETDSGEVGLKSVDQRFTVSYLSTRDWNR